METRENIYDQLQEYFGLGEGSINILEEEINTDVQVEYFEYTKNHAKERSENEIFESKDIIFDQNASISDKKDILVELASISNIEAYRTIEKYLNSPNIKLYDWACMALQESRLLIESKILEESKVLISTGLGGKGLKLRYMTVFFTANGHPLSDLEKKIIRSELDYRLPKSNACREELVFDKCFAKVLSLVPIQENVQEIFQKILADCNEYGQFLYPDFIITNIRKLTNDEIDEMLAVNNIY